MLNMIFSTVSAAQIGMLVRTVGTPLITAVVMYCAGKGWISASDSAGLIALLISITSSLAMGAWGLQATTEAKRIAGVKEIPNTAVVKTDPAADPVKTQAALQAISQIPSVTQVVTTDENAKATPSPKVVATATEPVVAQVKDTPSV